MPGKAIRDCVRYGLVLVRPVWVYTCGCKSRCERITANKVKRNSAKSLSGVLTIAYFDCLGLSRLSWFQLLESPGAHPHAGLCGRGVA